MNSSPKHSPFPLVNSREVYRNPWIAVREDRVQRPGGKEGIFGVVTMNAGSSVLAVSADHKVYLTREYKYAIAAESLEVVSGGMDGSETPLDAAKRELQEETGLVARRWIDAGRIDPFTTVVSSPNYLFIALDLEAVAAKPDEGERIHIEQCSLDVAVQMVLSGRITHGASCVLILKAERLLKDD